MPFTGSSNVRFKMVSMMILTDIMTDEENMKLEDKSGKCMTPRPRYHTVHDSLGQDISLCMTTRVTHGVMHSEVSCSNE